MPETRIYKIRYFSTYAEAWDGHIKTAYVKAPARLHVRQGELEELCRTKFPEPFRIYSVEEIEITDLVQANAPGTKGTIKA